AGSLSSYAFVVLANLPSLSAELQDGLERYVRAGGSVLIALGTNAAGYPRAPLLNVAINGVQNYANVSSSGAERYASVGQSDPAQSWVGAPALWSSAKFFYALRVEPQNAQVLV